MNGAPWQGYYYNGLTAERHGVTVSLGATSIRIVKADRTVIDWPFAEVTLNHRINADGTARLERGRETLAVGGPAFLTAFKTASPAHSSSLRNAGAAKRGAWITALILGAVPVIAALYLWIIPLAASYAALHVPPAWEERLGESIVLEFTASSPECNNPEATAQVSAIITILDAAAKPHPYTFKAHIIKNRMVNALAAPGGHIIIFTGLLERAGTPEELAGVLSHEMQHVLRRHATKSIFQNLSTYMLITLATGGSGNAAGIVNTFANLRYSRMNEREADEEGLRLLMKAGIDPDGMAAFFKKLEETRAKYPSALAYLSTHPATGDRVNYLEAEIKTRPFKVKAAPLLEGVDWQKAALACSGGR
ncbi:MAG: M48 family metallopeptidase [Deltaproteobacteria bacterium]|nr:M48 family metallopeptidase [Deltaproteobacteria bacterium]